MRIAQSIGRRAGMLALLLLAAAPAVAHAQPQRVAGMHVTLQPPAGFVAAERFAGFQREDAQSSIAVTELPLPFSEMEARLTPESFAQQGMRLRGPSEPFAVDGMRGTLISATQEARGTTFEKWALMFGGDSMTVIVTATYPAARADSLREPMRQAVLSTRWAGDAASDPLEGIGFRVTESPRLRIARRMGNMLALNETGTLPDSTPGSPLLVIGQSVSAVDLRDLEAFSAGRLRQMATVSGITNLVGEALTLDGARAYEMVADAVHTASGTPLRVYQVVLAEGSQYLLMQGMVDAGRADVFIPEFRAVARSLRRTR